MRNTEQDFWCVVVGHLSKCRDILNLRLCSKELLKICKKSVQSILIQTENLKEHKIAETMNFNQLIFSSNNSLEDSILASLTSNKTELTLVITKCFRVSNVCNLLRSCKNAALCDIHVIERLKIPPPRDTLSSNLRILILSNCTFGSETLTEFFTSVPTTLRFLGLGGTVGVQGNLLSVLHSTQMNADLMIQLDGTFAELDIVEEMNWELINPASTIIMDNENDEDYSLTNRNNDVATSLWETKKVKKKSLFNKSGLVIEITFLQKSEKILLQRLFPAALLLDLESDSICEIEEALKSVDLGYTLRSALCLCSDSKNQTLLHLSCIAGDIERTKWLLSDMGSRTDLKDVKGSTVMHKICESKHTLAPLCASIVMSHTSLLTSSPVITLFEHNHMCETPLYLVAFRSNPETLKAILSSANLATVFDINKQKGFFKSIGGSRGPQRMEDVFRLGYRESMIDSYTCDDKGFTPVHAGVVAGSAACVAILLEMGFRPDYPNSYKQTPLDLAYRSGSSTIIGMLKSKIRHYKNAHRDHYRRQASLKLS